MAEIQERRQGERVPLDTAVDFRRAKEHRFEVRMHDLSAHGCKVALPERVGRLQTVWISMPGLETLQSQVCWASEWVAGVKFDRPMHQAVFDHMAAKLA
jgi:hypothetical protein